MQKILFITGSMNQTLQMHQIAGYLPEYECWFSHLFTDSWLSNFLINRTTLLDRTVLANHFKHKSEEYLHQYGLNIDYGAKRNEYDLLVYCSELVMPKRIRHHKTVWVQEGMTDRYTVWAKLVKTLRLDPLLTGNTCLNGSSNRCTVYCAASEGYKEYFIKGGTDADKITVTGMPNYDHLAQYLVNDFPHKGYVMVATTDMRETFRLENRIAFIKKVVELAAGRPLLFKLHPNEHMERAQREIRQHTPANTLIYHSGNTNEMIANCDELITQYSTVVYTGIALGKKVHSWFDIDQLKKLMPLQNGGTSAQKIADVCREQLNTTDQPIRPYRQEIREDDTTLV